MTVERHRVLIGQIFQETHGFTPLKTQLSSFVIETGKNVISANQGADSVLGGLIRVGQAENWELVPCIAARASPGGRVTDEAYAFIKQHFISAALKGGFDAIALCLHGCMQTETLDSAEDDLLQSLRHVVGNSIPIVAGFDLHAHANANVNTTNGGMLRHLDFASAYKTNPHADAGITGQRVGQVLASVLAGGCRPVGCTVAVPLLTSGNDETSSGPLFGLHALACDRVKQNPLLLDASIFNVNPFIDGAGVGQNVVVYARNAEGLPAARNLAQDLAAGLWHARRDFSHQLPELKAVLTASTEPCMVLGDFGDRVLAGGPGDSLYVLAQARMLCLERYVVSPVTDPSALAACVAAGVGAKLTLKVGACYTPSSPDCEALSLCGTVVKTGNGNYTNRGAYLQGASMRVGPYAVFEGGGFTLLITQDPLMSQDPGCFLDCGIDLNKANIIVSKSGYHFKLGFGGYGPCVCVATPGLTLYAPKAQHFIKARPLFPLDDFEFVPEATDLPAYG